MNVTDIDKEFMMQAKIKALGFLNKADLSNYDFELSINSIINDICRYPAFDKTYTNKLIEMGKVIIKKSTNVEEFKEFIIGFNFDIII